MLGQLKEKEEVIGREHGASMLLQCHVMKGIFMVEHQDCAMI